MDTLFGSILKVKMMSSLNGETLFGGIPIDDVLSQWTLCLGVFLKMMSSRNGHYLDNVTGGGGGGGLKMMSFVKDKLCYS
jgi:hypothetical protein